MLKKIAKWTAIPALLFAAFSAFSQTQVADLSDSAGPTDCATYCKSASDWTCTITWNDGSGSVTCNNQRKQ